MGYQFVHLQTFSRKPNAAGQSTSFVFGEASRDPAESVHVADPLPPVVLHGCSMAEARAHHDAAVDAARVTDKNGKSRKVRQDQHTLATVVASHPCSMDEFRGDAGKADAVHDWEARTVAWLRSRYGDDLVSVVAHYDEGFPHLHAAIVPAGLRARDLHPGVAAKAAEVVRQADAGADAKAANRAGDAAYKQAMREWQDSYWQEVGIPCGLTRLGPGRRRLERVGWKAEQAQAQHVGELVRAAERAGAVVDAAAERQAAADAAAERAAATVERARAAVERAKAEADAAREAARAESEAARAEAERVVREAERRAGGILARAREQAERLTARARSVGETIGAAVFGLVGKAPGKVEARGAEVGAAAERAAAEAREAALREAAAKSRQECRSLRRDLADAHSTIRDVAAERDELRAAMESRSGPGVGRPFRSPP